MEHSVQSYLRKLPTETLEKFLQDYLNNELPEDYSYVIGTVVQEIALRKEDTEL